MTGPGYVIIETSEIRRYAPEFQSTLRELEARLLENTVMVWGGLSYGGLTPREKQFGRTTFLPQFFADQNGDVLDKNHSPTTWGRNSFNQLYNNTYPTAVTLPNWKTILQGGGTPIGVTPEDIRMAWAGLAFATKSQHVTKIRFRIGDTSYPIMDVEEVKSYEKPTLIFEEGFEIPEETSYLLRGWFEASGHQRIVPLGFCYYRRKDNVLTE
jgi:hypothetical protein